MAGHVATEAAIGGPINAIQEGDLTKIKSTRPVAARFYGVFADGGLKIRGPACPRHDTAQFIKGAQEEMLDVLSKAQNIGELRHRRQEASRVSWLE